MSRKEDKNLWSLVVSLGALLVLISPFLLRKMEGDKPNEKAVMETLLDQESNTKINQSPGVFNVPNQFKNLYIVQENFEKLSRVFNEAIAFMEKKPGFCEGRYGFFYDQSKNEGIDLFYSLSNTLKSNKDAFDFRDLCELFCIHIILYGREKRAGFFYEEGVNKDHTRDMLRKHGLIHFMPALVLRKQEKRKYEGENLQFGMDETLGEILDAVNNKSEGFSAEKKLDEVEYAIECRVNAIFEELTKPNQDPSPSLP